ncbi:hypothetical protein MMC32_002570 [Xylographa parallela]|nr:hypothetical protein [Xylographa parallela]
MARNNLNCMPPEILLQILCHLLITDPDGDAYHVDPMREDEKRYEGRVKPKRDLQPAILRTSKTLYSTGIEILYGCNVFKFCTARTFHRFIVHINQSQLGSLSLLIRRLLLIIIINTTCEAEEWISCLTEGLFPKNLPNLKRASVFLSHTWGDRLIEPEEKNCLLSETVFNELGFALKKNVKADSMYFNGLPSRIDPLQDQVGQAEDGPLL